MGCASAPLWAVARGGDGHDAPRDQISIGRVNIIHLEEEHGLERYTQAPALFDHSCCTV